MKKIVSFPGILVILLLLLGEKVGSQEIKIGSGALTLNGKVASGVFYETDNVDTEGGINDGWLGSDGRVRMWNESDPNNGLRVDFTAVYTVDNVGFRFRLRADNDLAGEGRNVLGRYGYGWINLFDNKFTATGGYIDLSANVWGTQGDLDKDIGGNGVRLEFKPIPGLNIGAFLMAPQLSGKFATIEQGFMETVFGFRYTNPLFYVSAQAQLDGDFDGSAITDYSDKEISGAKDEMQFMFGVGFTGVPGLKVTAEGALEGLGNTAARGKGDFRQTVSYDIDDKLTVGVKAKELLWLYDAKEVTNNDVTLNPWMQFKPFVNYKLLDNLTVGLEGGFGFGYADVAVTGSSASPEVKLANETYDAYAKPNLSVNLGLLQLKAWYKLTFIGYDDAPTGATSTAPKAKDGTRLDSAIKNQIALEFVWSF